MSAFKFRMQAIGTLLRRYKDVFQFFWERRHHNDLPRVTPLESEFLPSALSLQTRPVSPVGRWTGRLIMGLLLGALIWSILGKVDIIVIGTGKVSPIGQPKVIAATEAAYVSALFVTEGSVVRAGDPLIQLDPRQVSSEEEKALGETRSMRLQHERSRALLAALDSGQTPQWRPLAGIDTASQEREMRQMMDIWQEYSSKRVRYEQEIAKLQRVIPLLRARAADYADLLKSGDVARHAWAEKEQARIETEAQVQDMQVQLKVLVSETRKTTQESLREAERNLQAFEQDVRRASVRREQMLLKSPVDGVVQQLSVNTVGGVTPAAQPLMQIVPAKAPLEIVITVENKDIGFLEPGQDVNLKVVTYDYTKYGTIPGKVSRISANAVDDEKRGLIYYVGIEPERQWIEVKGERMPITAGQAINAEIRTGERRVIEYLLSPLVRHLKESLHER